MWISDKLECRHLGAKGQARFRQEYQTIDHIFTICTIIKAACLFESLLLLCGLSKVFYSIPREALLQKLHDLGILETLLVSIMQLYDSMLGIFRSPTTS